MARSSPLRRVLSAVLLGGLVLLGGCPPNDLHPVDDTASDDTGDTSDTSGPEILGILVTPERAVIPLGGKLQLTATGLLEGRESLDVTAVATWGSGNSAVAQVSDGLDEEGVLEGLTVGETTVYAEMNGVRSVAVDVKVTSATLDALTVTPNQVTVEQGATARAKAEATYSDGSRSDASNQVIWVTDDSSIVTLELGGKINAVATGSTRIHAELEGIRSKDIPVSVVQGSSADLGIVEVEGETGADDVTLNVTIENTGTGGASDFWVDVFVDPTGTPSPGALGDYYEPVFYADAGETLELSFNFEASTGMHTIWVVLDTDDAVAESDETNNSASTTVNVGASAGGNNLTIGYFDYYADESDILYVVDVYNGGTESVGPFWVDLWVHSEDDPSDAIINSGAPCVGDDFEQVDEVGPGETAYLDFVIAVADLDVSLDGCEYCWSWVMVDTCGAVEELHEDDNVEGPLEVEVPPAR